MLDSDGPRPALVTRTAAGRIAVARAARGVPFGTLATAPLPAGARLGAFSVLRDGALALVSTRPCRTRARVADVVVRSVRGAWSAPVRVNRCGDPEPVEIDATGRALFIAAGPGVLAWSSAPVERYTRGSRGGRSQRSGR